MELYLIPLIFAIVSGFAPKNVVRYIGMAGAVLSLGMSLTHALSFSSETVVNLFNPSFISFFGVSFKMGYDGMGLLMILLTNFVFLLIILSNYNKSIAHEKSFMAMAFLMQFGLLGVFTALDGIMFYVFWELTLIPIFLIALWYGDQDKKPTLIKFFIYTFIGSLAMLISLMAIGNQAENYSWEALKAVQLTSKSAFWIMGGFFLAFAIKIPLFPFHTWQPATYTSAPTAGTMLLSALMLKMALYGMVRWMIPLAPEALPDFKCIVIILGLIGIVYGALIAIKQSDIKRLIAFSSISHVGLIAAGIVLFTAESLAASYVQIVNHSLVAVGLFLAAGILEDRIGSREFKDMGGVAKLAPKFAFWFACICFAGVSVPFTSGFIGEFLLIKGLYSFNWIVGLVAGTTLVFGAVYTLRAYQLSMFGAPQMNHFKDLQWNEWLTFFLIMIAVVWIGIYPQCLFDMITPSLDNLFVALKDTNTLLH